ncbi:hypothetical protein B0H11DRAFT_1960016 [Mycena galericulata]|nr:hypothetical protein B0H11DRAFT_1960016 [Mycena galericulata]
MSRPSRMPALSRCAITWRCQSGPKTTMSSTWLGMRPAPTVTSQAGAACRLCTGVALPAGFVADVITSIKVYDTILPAAPTLVSTPTDLHMTITRGHFLDSLYHVAPKNFGGKGWITSEEYLSAQRTWSNTGFEPLTPCMSFGWLGVQRKTISREDVDHCDAMMLLGAVDYDLDRVETFGTGFTGAIDIAKRHIAEAGTRMQGAALVALINYDLQKYVRPIQEKWVKAGRGAANSGPQAFSPDDWVSALIADGAAICPYGYENPAFYTQSKLGAFVAILVCNTHDLLYDLATSNLMSSVMYAAAAGVTKADLHCIFTTSFTDVFARRICASGDVRNVIFGENALLMIGAWAGFGERYRTWERFVKYSRQIARSSSADARNITDRAAQQTVLADCNLLNAWHDLTTKAHHDIVPRVTVAYVPSAAPEMAKDLPDLCSTCMPKFLHAVDAFESDEIHAIEGLPASVGKCSAVARAAVIRRTAIFATSESCCDVCACRIGCWGDVTSHRVLTALIAVERTISSAEWLLQCYAVWAVMTAPVSIATVLSGFDLCCKVMQDEGAMGVRDVLDC